MRGVMEIVAEHKPDCLAMEQLYSHYERPRTAILMGHARGVICLAAAMSGIEVTSYEPTKVKNALDGNGRAPKHQMQGAVATSIAIAQCH